MFPVARGANGQPPMPADRGVQQPAPRLERGDRVRVPGVASVVQVDADRDAEAAGSGDERAHLASARRRRSCRRDDLVGAGRGDALPRSRAIQPGSTAPSNGQPNEAPIVTVTRRPSARRAPTMRVGGCDRLGDGGALVALVERLGGGEGEVHLVEPGHDAAGRSLSRSTRDPRRRRPAAARAPQRPPRHRPSAARGPG